MDTRLVYHAPCLFTHQLLLAFAATHWAYSRRDGQAELTRVAWWRVLTQLDVAELSRRNIWTERREQVTSVEYSRPAWTIEVRGLDDVVLGIDPVQLTAGVVHSQTVGPEQRRVDDDKTIFTIHWWTLNTRPGSPVTPVQCTDTTHTRWHVNDHDIHADKLITPSAPQSLQYTPVQCTDTPHTRWHVNNHYIHADTLITSSAPKSLQYNVLIDTTHTRWHVNNIIWPAMSAFNMIYCNYHFCTCFSAQITLRHRELSVKVFKLTITVNQPHQSTYWVTEDE